MISYTEMRNESATYNNLEASAVGTAPAITLGGRATHRPHRIGTARYRSTGHCTIYTSQRAARYM